MWALRAILVAALVIAIVAFAIHNVGEYQKVDVNLIWKSYTGVALIEVVFWAFVGGVVVSLLAFISVYVRLSMNVRSMRRQMRGLESELVVLRNRPIEESAKMLEEAPSGKRPIDSPFGTQE